MEGETKQSFVCGLLGDLFSFMSYLVTLLPLFYKIYKNKSSEGISPISVLLSLLNSLFWIYFALIDNNSAFLVIIHGFGLFINSVFMVVFLIFASKENRILTARLLIIMLVFVFGGMIILTHFLVKGEKRMEVLEWICAVSSLVVFSSNFFVLKHLARTFHSHFSFYLSLGVESLGNVSWLLYGFAVHELFVAVPNIVGVILGVFQVVIYIIYKKKKVEDGLGQVEDEEGNEAAVQLEDEEGNEAAVQLEDEEGNEAAVQLEDEEENEAAVQLEDEEENEAAVQVEDEEGNEAAVQLEDEEENEAAVQLGDEEENEAAVQVEDEEENEAAVQVEDEEENEAAVQVEDEAIQVVIQS